MALVGMRTTMDLVIVMFFILCQISLHEIDLSVHNPSSAPDERSFSISTVASFVQLVHVLGCVPDVFIDFANLMGKIVCFTDPSIVVIKWNVASYDSVNMVNIPVEMINSVLDQRRHY